MPDWVRTGSIALLMFASIVALACGSDPDTTPAAPTSDPRPGGIQGTVTDEATSPMAGLRVGIVDGTAAFPEIAPETDSGGRFRIGSVSPDKFRMAVRDENGEQVAIESVAVESGKTSTVDMTVMTGQGSASAGVAPSTTTCREYLNLLVSTDEGSTQEPAVATSYRCMALYVDSTGRQLSKEATMVVARSEPLALSWTTERQPNALELRLYVGTGIYGSFGRWPEELFFPDEGPVDTLQPTPSLSFHYLPQQPPGEYSLVVSAAWGGPIDVFYAISFSLQ